MAFSYSGITNYGKVTLPSVSGGLGSMHIMKDPPRSIHTRRKDRVGQTMDHVQMIEDSSSRASEAIRQYALGVNPMVSVSYSNHGNNGGQGLMNFGSATYGKSAYNPYALGAGGFQFRPPVRAPQELLPLSRQPRTNTTFSTNPEMVDWTKKLACPSACDLKKEIILNPLQVSARPTERFIIETPINEPFEVKYVIQNPTRVTASAGMRTREITDRGDVTVPTGGVHTDVLDAFAVSNMSDSRTYLPQEQFGLVTDKYIQDNIRKDVSVSARVGRRVDHLANEAMSLDPEFYIQDNIRKDISVSANVARRIDHAADEFMTLDPSSFIQDNIRNNVSVTAPIGQRIDNAADGVDLDTSFYIQDRLTNHVQTNKGMRINRMAGDHEDNRRVVGQYVKEKVKTYDYAPPVTVLADIDYMQHGDIDLQRNTPLTSITSNVQQNVYKKTTEHKDIALDLRMPAASAFSNTVYSGAHKDISSHEKYLPARTQRGGFANAGFIPSTTRISGPSTDEGLSEKTTLLKKAAAQFQERYANNGNPYFST